MYHSPVAVLCYDVLCVCSTGEEVDEEYRANHEMEHDTGRPVAQS